MLKKIFFLISLCLLYSSEEDKMTNQAYINSNLLTGTILESSNQQNIFWIDIHCHNIDDIAGVQFELSDSFELLDVAEVTR